MNGSAHQVIGKINYSQGTTDSAVFELGETRHMGARYYTVQPSWGWNLATAEWCRETYGPVGCVWDHQVDRWFMNDAKFLFRDEADRTLFLLRWA
jgi:hypothetical protein